MLFFLFFSQPISCDLGLIRHSSSQPVKNLGSRAIGHLNKCPGGPAHPLQCLKFAGLFPLQQTGRNQAPQMSEEAEVFSSDTEGSLNAIKYCCGKPKGKDCRHCVFILLF